MRRSPGFFFNATATMRNKFQIPKFIFARAIARLEYAKGWLILSPFERRDSPLFSYDQTSKHSIQTLACILLLILSLKNDKNNFLALLNEPPFMLFIIQFN